ncbi:class I SAM-dependent methyltransferase [Candidatus Halobeggiatoa sp. HSG11]|nr:class I SAM-dependent methyltransferase [Candidatus Halobeggiatoa sp. HSG11]
MKNNHCINCGSPHLQKFLDLGKQPNGNVFPSIEQLHTEHPFPCAMLVCTSCWQVQLESFPSVENMFSNHPYVTGLNQPVVAHFARLTRDILQKFPMPSNSLVLDIGANDGSLLANFRHQGMRVLGIDPCKKTEKLAQEKGVKVLRAFWDKHSARKLQDVNIQPQLITATAVFYHVDDIHSFVQGLDILMQKDTIFCTQCIYLKEIIEKLQFDHFYHEHTMIHAIAPLEKLFSQYGLRLLDVGFYPIHGGSFVLYVGREEAHFSSSPNIAQAIAAEKKAKLNQFSTYEHFAQQVAHNKQRLLELLRNIKQKGQRVFGLGAPLKGNTLLNYYGIDSGLIECVTEVNPYKIGKYTPGSHIPVVSEKSIQVQPDYYLLLSWSFLDFFIEKYADYLKNGGQFIVPHPHVNIIDHTYCRNKA